MTELIFDNSRGYIVTLRNPDSNGRTFTLELDKILLSDDPIFDELRNTDNSPVASIITSASNSAPTGYLRANGAAISRTTYSRLFQAIGVTFGAGNGTTTFNLPDLRGMFLRGWSDGREIDVGRVFGSTQADSIRAHTHEFDAAQWIGGYTEDGAAPDQRVVVGKRNTESFGGTETRPYNVAVNFYIKF